MAFVETLMVLAFIVFVFFLLGKKKRAQTNRTGTGPLAIPDRFDKLEQVEEALRVAGLESSNLILAVDYTKSNLHNGRLSFAGRSLHAMNVELRGEPLQNPYQQVMHIVARTLLPFDDDGLIPAFGFGDQTTRGQGVFPFWPDRRPARGLDEVLARYNEITPYVVLSGPTNFAPAIRQAVQIVQASGEYHILVIIADGEVIQVQETRQAIIEASYHPLSIVCVGVGDGPFDLMHTFDDNLPERQFDNFQFVNFNHTMSGGSHNPEAEFARCALQEIPEQFKTIRRLGLLDTTTAR